MAADRLPDPEPDVRYPECVANWPECEDGAYDPRCCRFPKSCSPVAADRLPDPRAGKERACKCGKMLVSNVIEVGFPCPFCGDKGGPVSAAVSPAEPPERRWRWDETPAKTLVRGALWIAAIDTVPIENRAAKVDEWMALVAHYTLIERTFPDGR